MVSHRSLGLSYLEEERYSDALKEFNSLVKIAGKEPLGYTNLGLTYMRMSGQLQQSEEWLKKALVLAPDDPEIIFLLSKVYELTGRQLEAKNSLEKILKNHPYHIRTLYQLGLSSSKSNDSKYKLFCSRHILVERVAPGKKGEENRTLICFNLATL